MQRGLDIFELTPSPSISQNEIDAAKTVRSEFLNVQDQQKFVWPPSFALSLSYADQLDRWHGLSAARVASIRGALVSAEGMSGLQRRDALASLALKVNEYVSGSSDKARVQWLVASIKDLSSATK